MAITEFLGSIMVGDEQIREFPDNLLYESGLPSRPAKVRQRGGDLIEMEHLDRAGESILAHLQSFFDYPEITTLSQRYKDMQIYGTWHFGRDALLRRSQPADGRGERLEEDHLNLGLVLNHMGRSPQAKQSIIDGLRELYHGFTNYEVIVNGGSVQLFFTEEGKRSIPATRLSDGTLRYLCLLAILYNPHPHPVVCIEEPELGLHPDIVAGLAKHLRAASERTQLIVTTHSDILIDALSDSPEAIVVFEKHNGATLMNRLDADELSVWLKDYSLGQLWTSGQLGGARW